MKLELEPEEELARRLLHRRSLVPRIDIFSLVREYAFVEFVTFPVDIDGICKDLKSGLRRPTVYVNRRSTLVRQRFTLAHELGHILIPWHLGQIVDEIDGELDTENDYGWLEMEANRFASELLLPTAWIAEKLDLPGNNLDKLVAIADEAEVSFQAAAIKIIGHLPAAHVIATSQSGIVTWSQRSEGTTTARVPRGTDLRIINPFPFSCEKWSQSRGDSSVVMWYFPEVLISEDPGTANWREILDRIVASIIPDAGGQKLLKSSINGVTSAANGSVRAERNINSVATTILHRLHARASNEWHYKVLVNHPDFKEFLNARARSYFR